MNFCIPNRHFLALSTHILNNGSPAFPQFRNRRIGNSIVLLPLYEMLCKRSSEDILKKQAWCEDSRAFSNKEAAGYLRTILQNHVLVAIYQKNVTGYVFLLFGKESAGRYR